MVKRIALSAAWQWIIKLCFLAVSVGLFSGCAHTTSGGAVGVDRSQLMLVSSAEINDAASKSYLGIVSDAKKSKSLNVDAKQTARVQRIVKRLIPNTGVFRPEAVKWQWEANVITDDQVNAWCMPGGKIVVYSGIINQLNLTDDELAAIIGHEIAHALREHGREQASRQMATGLGLSVAGAFLGVSGSALDLASVVTDVTLNLPNSREAETEADRIGVELAARSGYDPRAAIVLWQKMEKISGGSGPAWLSTHPASSSRAEDLGVYAQKVLPLYQAAKK